MTDPMDEGRAAYERYTAGKVKPDGTAYAGWGELTLACRWRWQSLAECMERGGGVPPASRHDHG